MSVLYDSFLFNDETFSKTKDIYYLEPGFYPSITDIVEARNSLIQDRNNHTGTCIRVKVCRRPQQIDVSLVNEESSLVISSLDLGHIFGGDVRNYMGILLRGKGPHTSMFAYDIVRFHSLMIYTDIVEYNIVGETKAPLLRCFPFISKLKSGDTITRGQIMNYQTFSNLQFRTLLKNSFHSVQIDLRDTSGEKIPFVSVGITLFKKLSDIHL